MFLKFLFVLLAFIFIPFFEAKIAIIGFFLIKGINNCKIIHKRNILAFLFFFFSLAYLLSPYSHLFNSPAQQWIYFASLFILGISWSWAASSDLRMNFNLGEIRSLVILTVLLTIVNAKPLRSDISWRGDEDYHIGVVLQLIHYLKNGLWNDIHYLCGFLSIGVVLVTVLGIFLYKKRPQNLFIFGIVSIVILAGVTLLSARGLVQLTPHVLRYPFVEKWISLFLEIPYIYSDLALHRFLPFLSSLIMAGTVFYMVLNNTKDKVLSILWAFVFSTVPIIYFYSSLMYLEMPIMALMMFCLMDIRALVTCSLEEIKTRPAWYLLLLISFLKETVFVFCVVFIVFRFVYQILRARPLKGSIKVVFQESIIGVLFLAPLFIYLLFRFFFEDQSPYGMQWSNILNLSNYNVLVQSLFNQMGLFILMGIGGFFILFRKDKLVFWFFIILFLMTSIFFISYHGADFVGYSRWNLFFIPFLFISAVHFIAVIKKDQQYLLIVALLVSNYFLCPIHWDGSRMSNWGSPKSDMAEYTYPYEEAIKYLSKEYQDKQLLILGQSYPYPRIDLYFHKYHFNPKGLEIILYPQKFDKATEKVVFRDFIMRQNSLRLSNFDIILYHSSNNIVLDSTVLYGNLFKVVKRVQNSEQSIYILKKVVQ